MQPQAAEAFPLEVEGDTRPAACKKYYEQGGKNQHFRSGYQTGPYIPFLFSIAALSRTLFPAAKQQSHQRPREGNAQAQQKHIITSH